MRIVTFVSVVLLAFVLRFHHYALFPSVTANVDERAWTWAGASILSGEGPVSWSLFDSYAERNIYAVREEHSAPLVKPWLDHPPLFGLIPGLFHLLSGAEALDMPSQTAIRFPMVLIGALNAALLLLVAQKLFDTKTSTLLALLYASSPLIIFSSRLVVADNVLATIVLLALLVAAHTKKAWQLAVLSCLSMMIKVQGVFIGAGIGLYFWLQKRYRQVGLVLLAAASGLALFAVWGWVHDWELFQAIFTSQSGRSTGLNALLHRFFFYPTLVTTPWLFPSKTLLFVLGCIGLLSAGKTKKSVWALAQSLTLSFLLLGLASFDETNINGWYEYALYPTLFLGLGALIQRLFELKSGLASWLIWIVCIVPMIKIAGHNMELWDTVPPLVEKVLPLLGSLPLAIEHVWTSFAGPSKKALKKHHMVVVLATLLLFIAAQTTVAVTLTEHSYNHQLFLLQNF